METRRRAKGSGSVYRRADGWWAATVELPRVDGKRRRRTLFARTSGEVEEKLAEAFPDLPPDTRQYSAKRSEREAIAREMGRHTRGEWFAKIRAYERRCHYCGVQPHGLLTKDHRIPISRGGSDHIDNIVPCCKPCNSEKSNLTDAEFLALLGRG